MATHPTDSLPEAASERRWAALLGMSRETLRTARGRRELRASRPGRRRLVILRDGPGGIRDWLDRHALGEGGGDEAEQWASARLGRGGARERDPGDGRPAA